jgi:heat shock protein HslJ
MPRRDRCLSARQSCRLLDSVPHGVSAADIEGREWQLLPSNEDQSATWPHRGFGVRPFISFRNGVIGGSPGCGQLTGAYHRTDKQIAISARWIADAGHTCDEGYKKDTAQILKDLSKVRVIDLPPDYWHDDALLLNDGKGITRIVLSPMQAGSDLSDLQDTFWHLDRLEGESANSLKAVIYFRSYGNGGDVTFSTPSCFYSFPFQYELAGLKFSPAWSHSIAGQNPVAILYEQFAEGFESVLHEIVSYEQDQGNLTFRDRDRHSIMVLNSITQTGIENRRWRIAKFRGNIASQTDSDGLIDGTVPAEITFVNGRVEGSPGCGGWAGIYMLSGDRFTFKGGWVLAGLCKRDELAQNDPVDGAMKKASRIEKTGSKILMRDETGEAQILLLPF